MAVGGNMKRNKTATFAISILLLCVMLFAVAITCGVVAYFSSNDEGGGNNNLAVLKLDVTTTTFEDDRKGNLLPDYTYDDMPVTIKTQAGSIDALIRAKYKVVIDGQESDLIQPIIDMNKTEEGQQQILWQQDTDGWYYYLGYVSTTETATFIRGYNTGAIEGMDIQVTVTVEAIQRQYGAYETLWADASSEIVSQVAEFSL